MKKLLTIIVLMLPIIAGAQKFKKISTDTLQGLNGSQITILSEANFSTPIKLSDGTYLPASTSPTLTISVSGGSPREYMTAGSALTTDLTWTATRPVNCQAISSITVDGSGITMDNPFAVGHTQVGVLTGRTLPRNTNTSYTISVVTSDKTASATASISWQWKRYWGSIASNSAPSDADILALTGAGVGTGSELSTTRVKTYNGINGDGNYLIFAFPTAWGTPVFKINGLTSTAFTKVRDNAFVNASGGSTNYQVWISNTVFNSAIAAFEIQ